MAIERSRITLLAGIASALALASGTRRLAQSESLPAITVYKGPT
jgi:hypothetical protein